MFKPSNPQRSLLECEYLVSADKAERLKQTWAEPFRRRILPLIDEEVFRDAFSETTGRPNKSIRLLVGVHLLKEWNDLTDEQVIDQLDFNLQWHFALGVESGAAHVCQKSLHNFRVKLMASERAQQVFEQVTRGVAEADGLNLGRQRLDSTHVLSNIAVLTRLGLFVETATHFLSELRKGEPTAYASLDAGYGRRYLEREGYFSDAKREQARRRLPVVAQDIYALVRAFEHDPAISSMAAFGLLRRLFEEQCEVVEDEAGKDGGAAGGGGGAGRVEVRAPKTIASDSLQSPYDVDASYGHKGKGYEVQVAESCDDDNPYQVITGTSVNGAHESDQRAVTPMLKQLEASGMLPDEILADTGYGSGANIVSSAERGVDLVAPVQDPYASPPVDHFTAPVSDEVLTESHPELAPVEAAECADESECLDGLWEFAFDATFHSVESCPAGAAPEQQHVVGGQLVAVFSARSCELCASAAGCPTRRLANGDRQLRRAPASVATEVRQAEQQTAYFKDRYRKRSGVESTNQELKGRHGLGDLRVRGKPRVELAATMKSLSLNVKRAVLWHVSQLVPPEDGICLV